MNTHQLNIRLLEVEVRTQAQRAQAAQTEIEEFFAKLTEEIDHGFEASVADFERESLLLERAKLLLKEALKAEAVRMTDTHPNRPTPGKQ